MAQKKGYSFNAVVFDDDKEFAKKFKLISIGSIIGIPFLLIYILYKHLKWSVEQLESEKTGTRYYPEFMRYKGRQYSVTRSKRGVGTIKVGVQRINVDKLIKAQRRGRGRRKWR